jgi:hypothetical protein
MTAAEACPLNWSCEPRAHNCHTEKQSLGKGLWELEMEEALLLSEGGAGLYILVCTGASGTHIGCLAPPILM